MKMDFIYILNTYKIHFLLVSEMGSKPCTFSAEWFSSKSNPSILEINLCYLFKLLNLYTPSKLELELILSPKSLINPSFKL